MHDDQQRFVDTLSAETGLDPHVAAGWVGTTAPGDQYRASHDYLSDYSVPYPSAEHAGRSWAKLVRDRRPNVMGSIPAGPLAQLREIAADPTLPSGSYRQLLASWVDAHRQGEAAAS